LRMNSLHAKPMVLKNRLIEVIIFLLGVTCALLMRRRRNGSQAMPEKPLN
jgi:hypothetical protein